MCTCSICTVYMYRRVCIYNHYYHYHRCCNHVSVMVSAVGLIYRRDKDLLRVEGLASVKPSCWKNGKDTNRSPVSLFVTRKSNPVTAAN